MEAIPLEAERLPLERAGDLWLALAVRSLIGWLRRSSLTVQLPAYGRRLFRCTR